MVHPEAVVPSADQPSSPPGRRPLGQARSLALAILAANLAVLLLVLFWLSDFLLGSPIGRPVVVAPLGKATDYSQAMAEVVTSTADTNIQLAVGLFIAVGYVVGKAGIRPRRLALDVALGASFLVAVILSIFFAIKLKSSYLIQMQFDQIDAELLEPAFSANLLAMLVACLLGLALIATHLGVFGDREAQP
ncbi:hypothetical protein [Zavarzinia sp.]|uniref:hypothetical protein n=1 Tax=Zavarzinia sp. TaxID=2027920 RepID=UPI003569C305